MSFTRVFNPETATNVRVYGLPIRSRVYRASAPDTWGRWWVSVSPTGTKNHHFDWWAAQRRSNYAAHKERQRIYTIWERNL